MTGKGARMTGEDLRVMGEQLRITCEEFRMTGKGARMTGEDLRVMGEQLGITGEELRMTGEGARMAIKHTKSPLPFYDHCHTLTAADAHRRQASVQVLPFHLVKHCHYQPGAGTADRMPQRNTATLQIRVIYA